MVYHSKRLDRTFAALADPTRRAILARLAKGTPTISELATGFDMSLPAVSKHIRVLESAGLTTIRKEGRTRRATLVPGPMRSALEWIEWYRQFWESELSQLAAYLEQPSSTEKSWQRKRQHRRVSKSGVSSARRASASSRRGRNRKS